MTKNITNEVNIHEHKRTESLYSEADPQHSRLCGVLRVSERISRSGVTNKPGGEIFGTIHPQRDEVSIRRGVEEIMPQLDFGTFPEHFFTKCLFCATQNGEKIPYTHGYLWERKWVCPQCQVLYRFGRSMNGNISGPFLEIILPSSDEYKELLKETERKNKETKQ